MMRCVVVVLLLLLSCRVLDRVCVLVIAKLEIMDSSNSNRSLALPIYAFILLRDTFFDFAVTTVALRDDAAAAPITP